MDFGAETPISILKSFDENSKASSPFKHSINIILLLSLATTLVTAFLIRYRGDVFKFFDTFDYAQIARNIARGEAYTTQLITPLSWSVIPELPHPEFWRAPLFPLLVASGFRVSGSNPIVPILVSSLSFIVTIVLLYVLGTRIANSRTGFLAGLPGIISPMTFQMGVLGTTESTFTMLFIGSILVVTWDSSRPILLGILCGFLYLTRFNAWFFMAGVLVVAVKKAPRKKMFLLFFISSFLLITSPWSIRGLMKLDQPFYNHLTYTLLNGTAKPEGWGIFFYFNLPNPFLYVLANPLELGAKWIRGIPQCYQAGLKIINIYWLALAIALLWFVFPERDDNFRESETVNLWFIFIVILLLQILILPFVLIDFRFFIPLLSLISVLCAVSITKSIKTSGPLGFMLFAVTLIILSYNLMALDFSTPKIPENEYEAVARSVPENELILSNKYFFLPWYADRRILAASKDYTDAEKYFPPFKYVFLHDDPSVLASRIHRNLHENYRNQDDFKKQFEVFRKFQSGAVLYKRK